MQKHLWIINHYATNESGRHFEMAQELVALGWKVTVFASSVKQPGLNSKKNRSKTATVTEAGGYTYVEIPSSDYIGNGLGRIKNMFLFYRRMMKTKFHNLTERPDIIIGSSVHPLAGLAGLKLSQKFDVPFVFEVRDLWPETLIAMGKISRKHPIAIWLKQLEAKLYKKSKLIISLLPGAYEYIEQFGVPKEKVVWISNGISVGSRTPRARA